MQDNDQLEMTELFRDTKAVLEDIAAIESEGTLGVKQELLNELDQICQTVETEFRCRNPTFNQITLFHHTNFFLPGVDQEIQSIQAMLASQFSGSTKLPYRLYAVFVHHGSVSFGHYWIYIQDFRKNVWRKYNDEYVTEVQNLDEIFKNTDTNNPPTPYFLVYINEAMKDRLVDPVCRDIPEWQPDVGAEDPEAPTAMEDVQSPGMIEDVNMEPPSYQGESIEHVASTIDPPIAPWPTAAEEKQAYMDKLKKDDANW